MQLSRIQLKNYRSLPTLDQQIENFQIIFGRNNAGKSNFLKALRDYQRFITQSTPNKSWHGERVYNKANTKEVEFCLDFNLSMTDQETLFGGLVENNQLSLDTISEMQDLGFGERIRHKFTIDEDSTKEAILSTYCEGDWVIINHQYEKDSGQFVVAETKFHNYPETEAREVRHGDVDRPDSVLRNPFDKIISETVEQWRWVSPFRRPDPVGKISEEYELQPGSANLSTVLHTLANNRPDKYGRIVDNYTEIMEGVTDVVTPIHDYSGTTKTTVEVVENFVRFDLAEISAGSKQILSLLTEIETAEDNASLLLLEEPETHLHPGAQRIVYTAIRELAEETSTQVLVTTHSDVFVDKSDSSQLVKAIRTRSGTRFREISPDSVIDELQDLGYSKSRLLQSKAVVFVEGRSDKQILREFSRTLGFSPGTNGVHLIDLEGEGNMKSDGQSLVKLLAAFEIPFLFILDSHQNKSIDEQNELLKAINSPDGDWNVTPNEIFVWNGYGIESYLIEAPAAIADVLEVDIGTIEGILEDNNDIENAAEVLNEVFTQTIGREYQKNADGVLIARKIPDERIQEEVKQAIEKIESMT